MQTFTQTTLDKLQVGDRFYKVGDKKKKVLEVKKKDENRWGNVTSMTIVDGNDPDHFSQTTTKAAEIQVIYLRSTAVTAATNPIK